MESTWEWAKTGPDNVVVSVESASESWATDWNNTNAGSGYRYISRPVESRDYPGVGWSYDEARDRFIPPMPDTDEPWEYSEVLWTWVLPTWDGYPDFIPKPSED